MYFEKQDARIYYEVFGDLTDPCLTLVNGFSRGSSDFRVMARALAEKGFSCLALDNRGSGKTESPLDFKLPDLVGDIVTLWDHLAIEQSHLLGISYGGVLSLNVAHLHPKRIRKLVLVSTMSDSKLMFQAGQLYEQSGEEALENLSRYFSQNFAKANPMIFKALRKDAAKNFADAGGRAKAKAQRDALRTFDFTGWLPELKMPTLVLHGSEDRVIDPKAAEIFAAKISGAQLEIFTGVGHLLLAECPKRFYETVATFLKDGSAR